MYNMLVLKFYIIDYIIIVSIYSKPTNYYAFLMEIEIIDENNTFLNRNYCFKN